MFESVIGGEKVGRYSFLTAEPYMLLDAKRDQITITRYTDGKPTVETLTCSDPLTNSKNASMPCARPKHPTCPRLSEARSATRAMT